MKDKLSALWGTPPVSGKATVSQVATVAEQPSPTPATTVTPVARDREAYVPWGREHTDTNDIEIRCRSGEWVQMREPFITGAEGVGDTIVTLKSTSGAVTIEGRNLNELRRLIRHRKVDFIQEFDPGLWHSPAGNMPSIERVTIHQTRVPQLVAQGPSR